MSKSATSLARIRLDLRKRQFERTKNGFLIIGSWYRKEGKRWVPCMVILPAGRPTKRKPVPCVILLDDAWRWALHGDVGDPGHCIETAATWFQEGVLPGRAFDKTDHMRLYDAINESLPDLLNMPPFIRGEQAAIADIRIYKPNGEVIEREITNDV